MSEHHMSQRQACRLVDLERSTWAYKRKTRPDADLRTAIVETAARLPRRGYRYICRVLRRKGLRVNHKRVYRLYRLERLVVTSRRRRKLAAGKRDLAAPPTRPNEQWCMDFMSDSLVDGRRFRLFNVEDVFTRESLAITVGTSTPGALVVEVLEQTAAGQGLPTLITVDNGPEFISNALDKWAFANKVQLKFNRPGKPQDNPFIESFNGRIRDECLNAHWFRTVNDAKEKIETWRHQYNTDRMHSSLNYLTPQEFRQHYEQTNVCTNVQTTAGVVE